MGRKTQWAMLVLAVALSGAVVGCGDDDGGGGTSGAGTGGTGGGGTGGTGGNPPTPATKVGTACTMDSECDGPMPDCLAEIDPAAAFGAFAGMIPQGQNVEPIPATGGYCSSLTCMTQAECGTGAGCYDLPTVTMALGFPISVPGAGICLDSCTTPADCTRAGYTCKPIFEFNTADVDAGALANIDAGFEIPDTLTGPSYCLPE